MLIFTHSWSLASTVYIDARSMHLEGYLRNGYGINNYVIWRLAFRSLSRVFLCFAANDSRCYYSSRRTFASVDNQAHGSIKAINVLIWILTEMSSCELSPHLNHASTVEISQQAIIKKWSTCSWQRIYITWSENTNVDKLKALYYSKTKPSAFQTEGLTDQSISFLKTLERRCTSFSALIVKFPWSFTVGGLSLNYFHN